MNPAPMDPVLHVLTPEQRQRRIAWVAMIIGVMFIAGCFWPSIAGWDMMRSGFGTITIFVFLVIVCAVTAAVYWFRANRVRQLFHGEGLLATWTYPRETWVNFLKQDLVTEARDKRQLFVIVAFFVFLIGGILWLMDPEAGGVVFLILMGVLALIAFVAFVGPKIRYQHQLNHQEPVWIGKTGVWMGGYYHDWTMLGSILESAGVVTEEDIPFLSVTYSYITRAGREETTVRIPIPEGKEAEATRLAEKLRQGPQQNMI